MRNLKVGKFQDEWSKMGYYKLPDYNRFQANAFLEEPSWGLVKMITGEGGGEPGERARGKRRGVSTGAAARHRSRTDIPLIVNSVSFPHSIDYLCGWAFSSDFSRKIFGRAASGRPSSSPSG